jgi:hypothetical protein
MNKKLNILISIKLRFQTQLYTRSNIKYKNYLANKKFFLCSRAKNSSYGNTKYF